MRLEQFVFCEAARQEASGQVTLIGVMPGNRIDLAISPNAAQGDSGIVLPSLCVYVVFDYMIGITEIETQGEVLRGAQIIQRTPSTKDRRSNPKARFHWQAFTYMPMAFPTFGDYQFKVILKAGGRTLSFARPLTVARGE